MVRSLALYTLLGSVSVLLASGLGWSNSQGFIGPSGVDKSNTQWRFIYRASRVGAVVATVGVVSGLLLLLVSAFA